MTFLCLNKVLEQIVENFQFMYIDTGFIEMLGNDTFTTFYINWKNPTIID